jgi:hypothetical protein
MMEEGPPKKSMGLAPRWSSPTTFRTRLTIIWPSLPRPVPVSYPRSVMPNWIDAASAIAAAKTSRPRAKAA